MPHFHFCRHLLFIITVFIKHSEGGDDFLLQYFLFPCASLPHFLLDWLFLGEGWIKGVLRLHRAQVDLRHPKMSLDPRAVGLSSS